MNDCGSDEPVARRHRLERSVPTDRTDRSGHGQNLTGIEMRKTVRVRARMRALAVRLRGAVHGDAGMVTSEYAVGIIAAVAFAAVLYKVLTSGQVSAELQDIVKRALNVRM